MDSNTWLAVKSNVLRLNLFDITKSNKDRKIKHKSNKGEKSMTKTIKIDGMMCPHCEGRVKQCLEGFSQVSSADVSHERGDAIITVSADISNDVIKETIENQGYKVISIL